MDGRPSHYEVLGVSRDATYDEIKESFHRLARAKHPDKQNRKPPQPSNRRDGNNSNSGNGNGTTEVENCASEFRSVQQAWKVLRDPEERTTYDSDLLHKDLQEENRRNGAIVLSYHDDLEEAIDEETNDRFMVYDCRCGEEIHIDESPQSDYDTEDDEAEHTTSTRQGVGDDILVDCPGCCFVYKIVGK